MAVIAGILPVNILDRRLRRRLRRGVRRRERAGQHECCGQNHCHPPSAPVEDMNVHARQRRSPHNGWLRLAGVFTEFDRDEQRPLRRIGEAGVS